MKNQVAKKRISRPELESLEAKMTKIAVYALLLFLSSCLQWQEGASQKVSDFVREDLNQTSVVQEGSDGRDDEGEGGDGDDSGDGDESNEDENGEGDENGDENDVVENEDVFQNGTLSGTGGDASNADSNNGNQNVPQSLKSSSSSNGNVPFF